MPSKETQGGRFVLSSGKLQFSTCSVLQLFQSWTENHSGSQIPLPANRASWTFLLRFWQKPLPGTRAELHNIITRHPTLLYFYVDFSSVAKSKSRTPLRESSNTLTESSVPLGHPPTRKLRGRDDHITTKEAVLQ